MAVRKFVLVLPLDPQDVRVRVFIARRPSDVDDAFARTHVVWSPDGPLGSAVPWAVPRLGRPDFLFTASV
jgi:hypothetical protein